VTSRQSQGLEFDVVCLVQKGTKELLADTNAVDADYIDEKNKIDRDLYYVSLTRAMEELHVLTIEANQ
jgi:superfamily I DNA/RNA helicase